MRGPRNKGLSLIEVVVSLGVLTIFLLGVFATLSMGQKAEGFSREHQSASQEAHKQLDSLLALPVDALLPPSPAPSVRNDVAAYAFDVKYGRDNALLTPADVAYFPSVTGKSGHVSIKAVGVFGSEEHYVDDLNQTYDLVEVEVTVAWKGKDGSNHRLTAMGRRAR